jgi:hypothetical protein
LGTPGFESLAASPVVEMQALVMVALEPIG